jgi:hypothetical protein
VHWREEKHYHRLAGSVRRVSEGAADRLCSYIRGLPGESLLNIKLRRRRRSDESVLAQCCIGASSRNEESGALSLKGQEVRTPSTAVIRVQIIAASDSRRPTRAGVGSDV